MRTRPVLVALPLAALTFALVPTFAAGPASAAPGAPAVGAAKGCDLPCTYTVRKGATISFSRSSGLDQLVVRKVRSGSVDLDVRGTGGGLDIYGTDVATSRSCVDDQCTDSGSLTVTRKFSGQVNRVVIRLVDTHDHRAELALSVAR